VIATAALTAGSAASASAFQNGGLEDCVQCTLTSGYSQLNGGSGQLTGWDVSNATTAQWMSNSAIPGFSAQQGSYYVAIAANGGDISQDFSTVVGRSYTVTFWAAALPVGIGGHPTKEGAVAATGGSTSDFFVNLGDGWTQETYSFTATSSSTTLSFDNITPGGSIPDGAHRDGSSPLYRLGLDDVSISSVPEPASWAMMIVGFGLIGGGLRRKAAQPAMA
jgi:hypothetical protein